MKITIETTAHVRSGAVWLAEVALDDIVCPVLATVVVGT